MRYNLLTSLCSALTEPRGWQSDGGMVWVGYSFAFMLPYIVVFAVVTWLALKFVKIEPKRPNKVEIGAKKTVNEDELTIPFIPADLSFEDLTYEVTASTSKDTLRLLNSVSGVFGAGRMCALMGSSGGTCTLGRETVSVTSCTNTHCSTLVVNSWQDNAHGCSSHAEDIWHN